ncbi:MAG TPA: chemotaxis protein CheW [Polyangiaceae bacterium]|nr:chemotaxis protein CheW [Polyangiaceae bacterium]
MSDALKLCTFVLGDLAFGVEVKHVQEVMRFQPLTRVPLASRTVRGILNLRGQIVTAIDVRARLGLPTLSDAQEPMNVVLRTSDGVVSLLVDEIGDVLEVSAADFERAPETLSVVLRDIVHGVYKLERRLLLLLDVTRAVALKETGDNVPSSLGDAA